MMMKSRILRCVLGLAVYVGTMSLVVLATYPATASDAVTAFDAHEQTTVYEGGAVWNGVRFVQCDIAVRDGVFVSLAEIDDNFISVDVSGKYITPPYANAHHHLTSGNDQSAWTFLEHGVFYVWNPNLISSAWSDASTSYFSRMDTYDVRTSMGGITEPRGHPEYLYVEVLSEYVYQGYELEDFLGNAFHYGRTPEEIDAALDLLVEQGAHFVKALLLFSEEYEKRLSDEIYYGYKGLNPDNFEYLVEAAHKRDMPVAVHVETQNDLQVAVAAGADMLAHLPGYTVHEHPNFTQITLTKKDAKATADSGILAVPTYALVKNYYQRQMDEGTLDAERRNRYFSIQANNLRLLADAGVPILTGTDSATHIYDEVNHWVKIGGLTPEQALKSVFQTGRYLFPDRKIGRIQPGYVADFLVLNADPTKDIANLSAIDARIKHGKLVSSPEVK